MTVTDLPAAPFVHPGVTAGGIAPDALTSATTAPADRTLKDSVLGELKRKTSRPHVTLLVPDRPGWSVDFDPEMNMDLVNRWAKTVTDDKGNADLFELSLLTIAGQCRGIRRDGVLLELDGGPVTFTSKAITDLYESTDARVTVREFYDNDVVVGRVYARLLQEAQAGSLDPTDESSS